MTADISEAASADMQFGRENSDEGETRPLAPTKRVKELLACVLQGGLDAINGRNWHWIPSLCCRQGIA